MHMETIAWGAGVHSCFSDIHWALKNIFGHVIYIRILHLT